MVFNILRMYVNLLSHWVSFGLGRFQVLALNGQKLLLTAKIKLFFLIDTLNDVTTKL